MSRTYEIDNFLRYISKWVKQNPDFELNSNHIYKMLEQYDISDLEKNKNFSNYFSYWIKYFKNLKNINVFVQPYQKNFLQFWNKDDNDSEFIKLYVNMKPESMLKAVTDIFSFTEKNNIEQGSKVANRVRSDSIVLRVKEEDAKKVVDYINNNDYIKENAKRTNPFIMREGVVGLAYDDKLSYNATVSFLIFEYIKSQKESNNLDNSNCIDFYRYVYNYSINLSNNLEFIEQFKNTEYFKDNYSRLIKNNHSKEEVFDNVKRVIDLIVFSVNEDRTYKDFIHLYESSKKEKQEEKIDEKALLDKYLDIAFNKYYTNDNVMKYLESYMSGNNHAITRDNNLRELFIKNIPPQKLKLLTKNNLEEYINNYLNLKDNYLLFVESCMATYEKYGFDQLVFAINKSIKEDYSSFTGKNFRGIMREKLKKEDVIECIKKMIQSSNIELDRNYGNLCAQAIEQIINQKKSFKK